ncbi:Stage III sporulation protein D [compost metagenome]
MSHYEQRLQLEKTKIEANNEISLEELAKLCGISKQTVIKDLETRIAEVYPELEIVARAILYRHKADVFVEDQDLVSK